MSVANRTTWYFLSSIGVPLISLAALPLYTTRLGPSHFGAFALGATIAGLISGVAGATSTLSLPHQLSILEGRDRTHYLSAVLTASLLVGLLCLVFIYPLYTQASNLFGKDYLGRKSLLLALLAGVLNAMWTASVEILGIEGKAKTYAILTFAQALINIAVVSFCIFSLGENDNALFYGFIAAAALGTFSAIVLFLRPTSLSSLKMWLPKACAGSTSAVSASIAENGKLAFERSYLAGFAGFAALGLYSHAQYYKNATMTLLNALSRGVLPTALEEAKLPQPTFAVTQEVWDIVQIFVACVCIGFAFIGRDVIAFLTHGKFTDAASYTVALLIVLLLQTAAKTHAMLLLGRGLGNLYANLNTASIGIAFLSLFLLVPHFGVWGAIISMYIQVFLHKIGQYIATKRITKLPFSDYWVYGGGIFSAFANIFFIQKEYSFSTRALLLISAYIMIIWMMRRNFANFYYRMKPRHT
ncbi:lipopolysaccharide biosynthesis protein [Paludibacterium purpuratum]|uniref:O-antigen/teichoic acid export membrane protein n=1 Tax=Paludibacterium purpuratum TaxID=1144873 RepID=A0A4R7B1C5_9NEIS|nr:oligosaccharide flippase family protein [Paludibacterium purpuratum]TDR76728.1 O-antigen/teichoic acid export membrane protein [Paludibacterium purpuratum]